MEITWGWDLVLILGILSLIVCLFAFDMIENWETKRRRDINLLLLMVSIYSLLVLLASELNVPAKLVIGSALIVLATMGHVAATNKFSEDDSDAEKPWELWFVAFFTLFVMVSSIVWLYLYTDAGRMVQGQTSKLSNKLNDFRMKRRARARARANAIEMEQF